MKDGAALHLDTGARAVAEDERRCVVGRVGPPPALPIECPVTIATASKDRLLRRPSYFARYRRMLPDAEWVVLDGVGHVPMSEDPDGVANLILSQTGRWIAPISRLLPRRAEGRAGREVVLQLSERRR